MNHLQACEAVARWALRLRWCDLAVVEIAGRGFRFGEPKPDYLSPEWRGWIDRRNAHRGSAAAGGGVCDVLALTSPRKTVPGPRIAICEVKVQVSDLRADLRKGKMLRYEPQATHCYLAAPAEVLKRADDLGLPGTWGKVEIGSDGSCVIKRNPVRNLAVQPTIELRGQLATNAAISLAWRYLQQAEEKR